MRLVRDLALWGLAFFLVFMLVQASIHPFGSPAVGQVKLLDAPGQNIVFAILAKNIGIDLIEPVGRYFIGLLELLAALLLLIPMWRRLGGILSFLIFACLVSAHMSPGILGREVPLSLLAGETATDGGRLFALSVGMLTASLLLIIIHPGRKHL